MRICCSLIGLALAASLAAQNAQAGFLTNVSVGATSRGAIANRAGQLLFRFDNEDYRGFGDATATTNSITGCVFTLQDQYDISTEQYDIRFYDEDLTTPNFNFPNFAPTAPAGTNELLHAGPFTSPGGTAGTPSAWFITTTFATPLALANDRDAFMAVELQASAAANVAVTPPYWPNDGLSVQISLGFSPGAAFTVIDFKGAGVISGGFTASSYGLVHDSANGIFAYGGPRQGYCDLLVSNTVGRGFSGAITNQTSYTASNVAPGTASFFSGLHPDSSSPPANGGRADTPTYSYLGATTGSIVFYLVDFSFSAFPLPLSGLVPGSTGVACLNVGLFQTLGFALANGTGTDTFTLNLTPGARTLIAGQTLMFQGVAFDTLTNVLHAGPCGAQRF